MKGRVKIHYLQWQDPANHAGRWRATIIYGEFVREFIHAEGATKEEARDAVVKKFIDIPEPEEIDIK